MGKLGITLAIGGTIVAMTLVIGMFALNTDTTTAATSTFGILGHYTVMVSDSDGNMKAYIQTDNALTFLYRNCLLDRYLGSSLQTGAECTIGTPTIRIGDGLNGVAAASTSAGLIAPYTVSGSGTAALVPAAEVLAADGVDAEIAFSNEASKITISQTDLNNSANGGPGADPANGACTDIDGSGDTLKDCKIDEVGLFDGVGGGNILSHAALTPTLVRSGDTVFVTLTLKITA